MRKGFTLVQLIIGVAVMAVLAVVVIMTINPTELSKQARDTTRLSDINTINKAVDIARTDLLPLGTANTIYVSIPDTSPTCANVGLAVLPPGWSYACVTAANLRKTDGTGWVPVSLTAASVGSPISKLPVDPVNSTSSNRYYTYMASGMAWTLTAQSLESAKQLSAHPSSFSLGNGPALTVPYAMTTYPGTGVGPYGIAFDGTNMWTANYTSNSVTKISPAGATTTFTGTGAGTGIAFDGTNMWTANYIGNSVTKISPAGATTTFTGTGANPYAIAFDGTNMWTANFIGNSVTKITPSGAMTTYSGTGVAPYAIAFDGTNMWTANAIGNSVTKISPAGAMSTFTETGAGGPSAIAFDGTNMWTVNSGNNSVTKISPAGAMTAYAGTGWGSSAIAFDGTNMWTANTNDNSVTKVTPSGDMTTYYATGAIPRAIAFDGTNMWTANSGGNSVTKIATR